MGRSAEADPRTVARVRRLVLRRDAADELIAMTGWLNSQTAGLGDRFAATVKRNLDRACEFPLSFPVFHREHRRILASPFKCGVLYLVDADAIVVTAIIDLRRDPRTIAFWLREEEH